MENVWWKKTRRYFQIASFVQLTKAKIVSLKLYKTGKSSKSNMFWYFFLKMTLGVQPLITIIISINTKSHSWDTQH